MLEHRVELGERLAAVTLGEQVRERVAEADDRVVLAVHVAVEPAPVGLDHTQDVAAELHAVVEGLGQHLGAAVGGDDGVEAFLEQADRVETGAGRDVEDALHATLAELLDEELALALVARPPVDELVPLVDEAWHVLLRVVIGVPDLEWLVSEFLNRSRRNNETSGAETEDDGTRVRDVASPEVS